MPIWVFMVRYDGEMACSTHLTEKGAVIAAIEDVLLYLGIEDEDDAVRVYNTCGSITSEEEEDPPEWDLNKIQKMGRDELYGVFGEWCEKTWDHHIYECEVAKTMVTG